MENSARNPKPYKHGSTPVGIKYLSPFNDEFYFQYLVLHQPHRKTQNLQHPQHERLPPQIKSFAAAVMHCPEMLTNEENVRRYFEREDHKDYYIATIAAHVKRSLDVQHLFHLNIITSQNPDPHSSEEQLPLTSEQKMFVTHVKSALPKRKQHYSQVACFQQDSVDSTHESESEEEYEQDEIAQTTKNNSTTMTGRSSFC